MHTFVKHQVRWIWIAIMAVLFSALAPAMSHAMAASGSEVDEAMQVCTMEGMKTVLVPESPSGKFDPHKFDHFLEHCPYCALHASPAMLPPVTHVASTALEVVFAYPPLFYQSVVPLFAWTAASPRAPPVPS